MKSQLLIPALIAIGSMTTLPLAHAGELTVTISDIRNAKGTILVSVVNSDAAWNNQEKPVVAQKIAATGKEVVLKFDLPAGDLPKFATAQVNVRGSVIPYWFFNARAIIALVESSGYRVTFKAVSQQPIDLGNFPSSHQIARSCHLLFTRV